jgi:hypothetical protein
LDKTPSTAGSHPRQKTHRIFAKLVKSRAQFGQGASPVVRKYGGRPAMDHRVMNLPSPPRGDVGLI